MESIYYSYISTIILVNHLYTPHMKKIIVLVFCLVCISCSLSKAQSYIITTVAGNTSAGYGGDGGQATAAELNVPIGIAIDASGNIYIADDANNRIRKIDNKGIITTIAGNGTAGYSGDGGPADSAQLNTPRGVAIDASGDIYIADASNNRIRKVDKNGIITTIVGKGTAGFSGDGGPADSAQLYAPGGGILLDSIGNLYIADAGNYRIRKVNTAGIISTIAGTGKYIDSGDGGPATAASIRVAEIYMNKTCDLYIDDYYGSIRVVNTAGIISTIAGDSAHAINSGFGGDGGLADSATFNQPWGVATDNTGNVYIADECNQRIRMINYSTQIISTIAGSGPIGEFSGSYSGDGGPATNATLNTPSWVILDRYGNIYISDSYNNCIRKLTPIGPTGINALSQNYQVEIFPNPGKGLFNFQFRNDIEANVVEVYNMLGEKVYSKTLRQAQGEDQIDLSGQPEGMYLYRITTDSGKFVTTGKFTIK